MIVRNTKSMLMENVQSAQEQTFFSSLIPNKQNTIVKPCPQTLSPKTP